MIPSTEVDLLIDLHVLSILSAFILSQDQTLHSILAIFCYTLFYIHFLTSLLLLLMFSLSSPIRIDKINIITLTSTMSTTFLLFFSFLSLLFRNTKKSLYYKAFLFYKISNSSEFSLYVLSSWLNVTIFPSISISINFRYSLLCINIIFLPTK